MDTLTKAIEHYQLPPLAPDRVSELEKYCRQLWSWNRRMNLTRHTDYDKFVARDLVDTIQLSALIPPQQEVLDVGTGGGVPGIVLAILRSRVPAGWMSVARPANWDCWRKSSCVASSATLCRAPNRRV